MESEIEVSEIETIKGFGEIRRIAHQYITMNPNYDALQRIDE